MSSLRMPYQLSALCVAFKDSLGMLTHLTCAASTAKTIIQAVACCKIKMSEGSTVLPLQELPKISTGPLEFGQQTAERARSEVSV